jgi:hypothetical protein
MASVSTPAEIESAIDLAEEGLKASGGSATLGGIRKRQKSQKSAVKRRRKAPAKKARKITKSAKRKPKTKSVKKTVKRKRSKQLATNNKRKLPWL